MDHNTETRPQRIARQRRQASDRARKSRQKAKDARKPNSRHVDAAITEALCFAFLIEKSAKPDTRIRLGDIYAVALLILIRNGFDRGMARKAISGRLALRPEHHEAGHVPSTRLITRKLPDRGWTRQEVELMSSLARRAASDG